MWSSIRREGRPYRLPDRNSVWATSICQAIPRTGRALSPCIFYFHPSAGGANTAGENRDSWFKITISKISQLGIPLFSNLWFWIMIHKSSEPFSTKCWGPKEGMLDDSSWDLFRYAQDFKRIILNINAEVILHHESWFFPAILYKMLGTKRRNVRWFGVRLVQVCSGLQEDNPCLSITGVCRSNSSSRIRDTQQTDGAEWRRESFAVQHFWLSRQIQNFFAVASSSHACFSWDFSVLEQGLYR